MNRKIVLALILIMATPTVVFYGQNLTAKAQENSTSITQGLMAWWKLNEGQGTTVSDSSGNNNDGTINGGTWVNTAGTSALSFNGQSNYVSLPSLDLTSLNSLTVAAWINSNLTQFGFFIYHGDMGEFELGNGNLSQYASGNPTQAYFSVKLSDANWYGLSSPSMTPNVWNQIVAVWTQGSSLKIYINGNLAAENNNVPNLGLFNPGSSFPSSLGIYAQNQWASACTQQDWFKGQMSNVMVYDRALSSDEVQTLYSSQAASIPSPVSTSTPIASSQPTPSFLWNQLNPSTSPSPRANMMMTFDPVDDVAVMFGGWNGPYLGDTWLYSFQNNTWIDKSPPGSPSPRERGGLVYATKHGEVVLFGGFDGSEMLNQTWAYNVEKNQWTELFPSVAPPSTLNMVNLGMVYDSKDDVVIVYSDQGDTWAYNITANIWVNMNPSVSPSPRALSTNGEQMVYDASDDAVVLFGGTPTSNYWLPAGTNTCTALNDTWAYYFESNTWVNLQPQNAPPARFNSQMAYDSVTDQIILYGGSPSGQASLLGDTWIYTVSSNQWTQAAPSESPPVRYASAMVFSPEQNEVLLFGGYNNQQGTFFGDTWALTCTPASSAAPSATQLLVSCQSSTSFSNFRVTINGSLTYNGVAVPGAPITLFYSINGGSSWLGLTTVDTDSNGNFLAEWMPSATGNYLINATYEGNSAYPSVNTTVALDVVPFTSQSANNVFSVASNATVSALAFDSSSNELTFTVSGTSGTAYVDTFISKSLIGDISALQVHLDGNPLNYTATSEGSYWLIHFTFGLCTHTVVMNLDVAAPKPTIAVPPQIIAAGIAAAILTVAILLFLRRKRMQ